MIPLDRRGFTLVELMIVTLIIGLLAVIALPMFNDLRDSAYVAVLERNLHGIAKAQELHFAEHDAYTDRLEALDFQPDSDVEVTLSVQGTGGGAGPPGGPPGGIGGGPPPWAGGGEGPPGAGDPATSGWAAHARHLARPVECALFTGDSDPIEPAETPGVVACEVD